MTDYKALYEQQLAENKELKEHWEGIYAQFPPKKLGEAVDQAREYILEVKEENKKLKEEIEELKEEVEERTTYAVLPAEGQFMEENKKLEEEVKQEKSKNSDLLSFIGGNFDYEDKVKEQIKKFYNEEFIKSNEEQWSQVCIDWDDSDFE